MPSSFKTSNFSLNSWAETDKPTRADFVSDNVIIDSTLANHINDSSVHLTAEEKARVGAPFVTKVFQGDDTQDRLITSDFVPRLAFCMLQENVQEALTNGAISTVYCGAAADPSGSTGGIYISSNGVLVTNETLSGVEFKLNEYPRQYILILVR